MVADDHAIRWAKDEISGWASTAASGLTADEATALYAELDGVLALLDGLASERATFSAALREARPAIAALFEEHGGEIDKRLLARIDEALA